MEREYTHGATLITPHACIRVSCTDGAVFKVSVEAADEVKYEEDKGHFEHLARQQVLSWQR